jgi:hypothetical protein
MRFKFLQGKGLAVTICLLVALTTAVAHGDTFTSTITSGNDAISPYPGPYGTVTVDLTSSTTATVTFDSGSSGGFTYLFIDTNAADLNVNASTFTATFVSATGPSTGGFASPSFVKFGSGNVDGQGSFNLTTTMFDGTDHASTQIVLDLTNTSGTWASAADVLAATGLDAAAHLVVFNSNSVVNGTQLATGFAGESGGSGASSGSLPGPEPSSLALIGSGLFGFGALLRRRLKKS